MADGVLELPLAGGAKQRFKTPEQFRGWLQDVRGHWQWFFDSGENSPGCVGAGRNNGRELLDVLESGVRDNPGEWTSIVLSICKDRFRFGFPLAPTNPVLAGLQKLYSDHPPSLVRAIGAYLYAERQVNAHQVDVLQFGHPVCLQAICYAGAARARLSEGPAAAAEALVVRAADEVGELVRVNGLALESTISQMQSAIGEADAKLEQDRDSHTEGMSEAIKRIDETKAAYEEVMRLKAPVDYWATKGTEHREAVGTYRWALVLGSVLFILVLAGVYWLGWLFLGKASKDLPEAPWALTIYVAGFVGAVTAIGLWIIRIVVRLYMSQHHLAADADERASLLRTYLALTQSGQVSEAERSLVLAAVFRPVPDGIVKDDGAPATTPLTLLASVLDRHGK